MLYTIPGSMNKWQSVLGGGDAKKRLSQFKAYTDYSIGFLTRGCFRKCGFCVNQKYNRVVPNSPLEEFLDANRKKICLLDDNFFGCATWKPILQKLMDTDKPFRFKQGLDERLLTDEKCEMLFNAKYDGDYIFAFDKVEDYDLIESKLQMIRRYTESHHIMFYVLVGFEGTDAGDIENAFKRIALLLRYRCMPYVMRYQSMGNKPYEQSPLRGMYITLARWCNQASFLKRKTFREFAAMEKSSSRYAEAFEKDYPMIAKTYYDIRFGE